MTVEGYFDGNAYVALEKVKVKPNQRVQITILDGQTAQEEMQEVPKTRKSCDEIRECLTSVRGKSHCWNGLNVDDYIRELREDREIVGQNIS